MRDDGVDGRGYRGLNDGGNADPAVTAVQRLTAGPLMPIVVCGMRGSKVHVQYGCGGGGGSVRGGG